MLEPRKTITRQWHHSHITDRVHAVPKESQLATI